MTDLVGVYNTKTALAGLLKPLPNQTRNARWSQPRKIENVKHSKILNIQKCKTFKIKLKMLNIQNVKLETAHDLQRSFSRLAVLRGVARICLNLKLQ